jgi:hypothetical protein
MNWNFLDIFDFISNLLNAFSGSSSSSDFSSKSQKKKKTKYGIEKISLSFLVISGVLVFLVFKDPLPVQNFVQTIVVSSCIGLAISLLFFFVLNVLELYYFKSLFQLLLFSCSTILLFISIVFCVYFESGIFI